VASEDRNSILCQTCGWRVRVPRRGPGQPFDEAMASHELKTGHFNSTFPVDDAGADSISDSDLEIGGAFLHGLREGARRENSRVVDLMQERLKALAHVVPAAKSAEPSPRGKGDGK
jgi:hypothetical protein